MKALISGIRMFFTQRRWSRIASIVVATIAMLGLGSRAAWAGSPQAQYLGDMLCAVTINLMPRAGGGGGHGLAELINGLAYIAGAVTLGSGLSLLVKHYEGRDTPMVQPLARLLGGCGLLSLPAMIQWLLDTFGLQAHGNGVYSYACGGGTGDYTPTPASFGIPLDELLQNLVYNIVDPLTLFLSVLSIIVGMVLVFRGLLKASKYGTDPKAYSVPTIVANLLIGAVLVSVGSSLNLILNTVFGGSTNGMWSSSFVYSSFFWAQLSPNFINNFPNGDLTQFEASVTAALTFFQLIGFIAFIRGWLILKNYVEGGGQATISQGLTHVFGGALAINIYQILIILDQTFGTGFFI